MIEAKYTLTGEVNVATQYIQPNLEEGRATPSKEEQVITPNEEYDGFSKVTLDPIPNEYIIPNGTLDIKANGTHDVTEKSSVNVDVQPSLQDKKVTVKPSDNIYVMPDEDYYGLAVVNVVGAVDTENIEITPTKEVQTINRSENKYIESVKVNAIPDEYIVPSGELQITENGNYDVTDKASVNVETSGADLTEYFTKTAVDVGNVTTSAGDWIKIIKKLPKLNIENVTTLYYYFSQYKGNTLDISNLNTININRMSYMFNNCSNLTSLDLKNFNTSNVTQMDSMFANCESLTSLDVSSFDTSNVLYMSDMFNRCTNLTSLDLSNFNTSNVTTMNKMFQYCANLKELDVSSFDTSKVTNMSYMFNLKFPTGQNGNIEKIILGNNFNTSKVTNMSYMFSGCVSLTHLDIRNFDFTKVTSSNSMFGNGASNYVPNDCLIIVKDETAKTWITSKFTRLTNVKTVAEYEAQ